MEKSTEEPQQHKQPSRKGKKAWRKHVDVSDVQAGLEQARDEVIKGSVAVRAQCIRTLQIPNKSKEVSSPRNPLPIFSPSIPKARKSSKDPTTKPTRR